MSFTRVRVKYIAPYIRSLVGVDEEVIEIREGATVKDLILKIAEIHGNHILSQLLEDDGRSLRQGVAVLVNGVVVQDIEAEVPNNSTVAFLLIVDGG
jgi:molybdopterin converting factor small subunit